MFLAGCAGLPETKFYDGGDFTLSYPVEWTADAPEAGISLALHGPERAASFTVANASVDAPPSAIEGARTWNATVSGEPARFEELHVNETVLVRATLPHGAKSWALTYEAPVAKDDAETRELMFGSFWFTVYA
jgi:hypothetical protein